METIGNPVLWGVFGAVVVGMLALDLGVAHRKPHAVTAKEAGLWSVIWVAVSALFGVGVGLWAGVPTATTWFTGYLLEKALAVDNIFVFVVMFGFFHVPKELQHKVLFWGVFGALVLRGVFIYLGAELLHHFHWTIYVFGGVLVATAVKLLWSSEHPHPERNIVYRAFRKVVPSTSDYRGGAFVVREAGRLLATPLLAVLVMIEATDVLFAVDSIPAIFAVTDDPFVVLTSNLFAVLGLRSMYFLLADVVTKVRFLKPGLSIILAFVGVKMLLSAHLTVPIGVSLGVIAGVIVAAIGLSWAFPPAEEVS